VTRNLPRTQAAPATPEGATGPFAVVPQKTTNADYKIVSDYSKNVFVNH
jgi:hypothetical protein